MATKLELENFANLSHDNAKMNANLLFYNRQEVRANKDDRKKFSHAKIYETVDMATNACQTQALEMIYKQIKDISEDQTISKEEKFTMLLGDVELLLQNTAQYFFKRYDPKKLTVPYHSITIDSMRERYDLKTAML